jgi:hypothetical protein
MKLDDYFRHFLKNTVNLNRSRLDQLDSRLETITSFLENHEVVGPLMLDVIPQGSYAQKNEWPNKSFLATQWPACYAGGTVRDSRLSSTRCSSSSTPTRPFVITSACRRSASSSSPETSRAV